MEAAGSTLDLREKVTITHWFRSWPPLSFPCCSPFDIPRTSLLLKPVSHRGSQSQERKVERFWVMVLVSWMNSSSLFDIPRTSLLLKPVSRRGSQSQECKVEGFWVMGWWKGLLLSDTASGRREGRQMSAGSSYSSHPTAPMV
ncbi:hypothetical protein B0H34DRAFT_544351 [Crassisporium funariophilum]|nr:hypothetical protein B0H34DRAFT_544351 [Crassisporium funariophilum]